MKQFSNVASFITNSNAFKGRVRYWPYQDLLKKPELKCYSINLSSKLPIQRVQPQNTLCKRQLCSEGPGRRMRQLTDFPVVFWPSLFSPLRNRIFSKFIIQRHFDPEFDLDDFVEATKQAVETVSAYLADGNWKELSEVVAQDVVEEIKTNIKLFSLREQMELRINKSDIFSCFVHKVDVIMAEKNNKPEFKVRQDLSDERYVEITMIYHVLKDFKDMPPPTMFTRAFTPFTAQDFEKKLQILTYRFVRDYSVSQDSSFWQISGLNHCRPLYTQ